LFKTDWLKPSTAPGIGLNFYLNFRCRLVVPALVYDGYAGRNWPGGRHRKNSGRIAFAPDLKKIV